jgi:hypothetical protein
MYAARNMRGRIAILLCFASQVASICPPRHFLGKLENTAARKCASAHNPMRLRGGGMLESIGSSLEAAEGAASVYAKLNETALDEFARSLDPARVKRAATLRFQLPLKYDDLEQVLPLWYPRSKSSKLVTQN